MKFTLPDNFLLGVSSASTQIEGGEVGSNWNDWSHRGKIKDGSDAARANDHWNRWKEDTDLMGELGLEICRFGVEWARIEPEEGRFDQTAIDRYREEIKYIKEKGMRPLLTLHHFSNPMWFEEKGAFLRPENCRYFIEFAEKCIEAFGDLVSDYITINEPNVYAMNGYFGGGWPPGRNSMGEYFRVLSNMAYCHIVLYGRIHEMREKMGFTDSMVSFANHVRVFIPKNPRNPWHRFCAGFAEKSFQGAISLAMMTGRFTGSLKNTFRVPEGEYADFIGINYYSCSIISGLRDGTRDGVPKNDLGWEIYPSGIVEVAAPLYKILNRPIWITENGTCDNNDTFRARYIADHLKAISESTLPFERYYHWCFLDNFEWIEGESARFGLIHVDYATQKRTPKRSALFFRELIANHGVTEEMSNNFF